MNRLTQKLDKLREENKKALVAYLVAGDPDMDSTLEIMHLFVESGVDIIEVGVPFTDPIAEGPIIQRAHDRAISCLLYTSPSPRDNRTSRMPSSA